LYDHCHRKATGKSNADTYTTTHLTCIPFQIHWKYDANEINFLASFLDILGWASIAFPEVSGSMVPADAVIGGPQLPTKAYRLDSRSLAVSCVFVNPACDRFIMLLNRV
jgi:hypothetical protein